MSPRDDLVPSLESYAPARRPRERAATRLLVVDAREPHLLDATMDALAERLAPGDLVVVNDAATIPASLRVRTAHEHAPLELRLAEAPDAGGHARAVMFGAGSWRQRTEDRPAPPLIAAGSRLTLIEAPEVVVVVEAISPISPRLLMLHFAGPRDRLDAALYRAGRPIQYAYLEHELPLWAVQTAYASRPWAVEPASAGLGLTWAVMISLRRRGLEIGTVTHAAGLSSTGDPAIDAALPLPERSEVPARTIEHVARTHARGGRVIAVGTSVVRALEGRFVDAGGELVEGERVTDHRLGPGTPRRVVDGILTGMHAPGESHHALLGAFLDPATLARATTHAIRRGYLAHELGDAMLVLGDWSSRPRRSQ